MSKMDDRRMHELKGPRRQEDMRDGGRTVRYCEECWLRTSRGDLHTFPSWFLHLELILIDMNKSNVPSGN